MVQYPSVQNVLKALDSLNYQDESKKVLLRTHGLWHTFIFLRHCRLNQDQVRNFKFEFTSSNQFIEACFDVNGLVLPIHQDSRDVYYEPAASQGQTPVDFFRHKQGPRQTYLNRIYTGLVGQGKKQLQLFHANSSSLPVEVSLREDWISVLRSHPDNSEILDNRLESLLCYMFRFGVPRSKEGESASLSSFDGKVLRARNDIQLVDLNATADDLEAEIMDFLGISASDFSQLFPRFPYIQSPAAESSKSLLGTDLATEILSHYQSESNTDATTPSKRNETSAGGKDRVKGGFNRIIYGAPGTGKSHLIDKQIDGPAIRTVFHPDTQSSDFLGALKPQMEESRIVYKFAPGPFARALATAENNPGVLVSLIVEELNRAPAAAVFGELFQLLDRNPDGSGKYSISFASPEFAKWYRIETERDVSDFKIPSNLSIWATMNSADQGVFPLDTAFRRRWETFFLPIDFQECPEGSVRVVSKRGVLFKLRWKDFGPALNHFLLGIADISISEDRLLGPWFVSNQDLENSPYIPEKVLLYLWDDLLRHAGRSKLFSDEIKTFGRLRQFIGTETKIFSDEFLEHLEEYALDEHE